MESMKGDTVKRKLMNIAGLLLVLTLLQACSSGNETQSPPQEETPASGIETQEGVTKEAPLPTESAQSNGGAAGPCANPYYPVREGATWNYQGTSSLTEPYTFTDTITSVRADGFTLTTEFEGLTRTQEWACKPEGILAIEMGGGLTTAQTNLTVKTQSASGVTFPAEINAGDTWSHSIQFTGTMDIAGNSGEAERTTQSDFTALGVESVTVPAGTFEAMKVQVQTTFDATVTFQGVSVPVTFITTTMSWYAQDVGWVKSDSSGDFMGQAYTDTIELQSYNLP
jgi:hypothetical protein